MTQDGIRREGPLDRDTLALSPHHFTDECVRDEVEGQMGWGHRRC